jgi:predicted SpoU family rRNA methylase
MMMKFLKLTAFALLVINFHSIHAQMKIVQITTIESTVAAGFGRSAMIITKEDGSQTESELNNLFSAFGINFGNVKMNSAQQAVIGRLQKSQCLIIYFTKNSLALL